MKIYNVVCASEFAEIFTVFLGVIIFLVFAIAVWELFCYLIKAFAVFSLAKKANANNPWMAFIPIIQNAKIFNLAGFNDKTFYITCLVLFLAYLIPLEEVVIVAGILQMLLTIYIRVRVAKNFDGGIAAQILNCFFEPIMLIYFALANKEYNPKKIHPDIEKFLKDCKLVNEKQDAENFKTETTEIPIVEENNN